MRTVKYMAAMLLISAGVNAYANKLANIKTSTSGRIYMDANSNQVGEDGDWSGHNISAYDVAVSLNLVAEQFSAKITLDAAAWYNSPLTSDGTTVERESSNKDLDRLLDEAYIKFQTGQGEITLGKQHIVLVPFLLNEDTINKQRLAVRFTSSGQALLQGIGINASVFAEDSDDESALNFNITLTKDINENLSITAGVYSQETSEEQASAEDSAEDTKTVVKRKTGIIVQSSYKLNSQATIAAQLFKEDNKSNMKIGGEYQLNSALKLGAYLKNAKDDNASDVDTVSVYGVQKIGESTEGTMYWKKNEIAGQADEERVIGFELDFKF